MYLLLLYTWFTFALIFVANVALGDQEKAGRQFVTAVLWPLVLGITIITFAGLVLWAFVNAIPADRPSKTKV